eukprot:2926559-Prymnesium_polylepis.1
MPSPAPPPPAAVLPCPAATLPSPAATFGIFGSAARSTPPPTYVTARKAATDFYLDCLALGVNLPPLDSQRRSEAQLVLDAFRAMTMPEETA